MIQKQQTNLGLDPKFTKKVKIAIIRPLYHDALNASMEKYCIATLLENDVKDSHIQTFLVPGSWELPLMVQKVAESKKFDAIIVFGVIVKGETYHFDMIAKEVGSALMQLSLEYSIPVALEVLAVYNKKDAEARAGNDEYNKGIEGAAAALKMLEALNY
jgi:6,7-dimethyl-8-ribityllumazine synthase